MSNGSPVLVAQGADPDLLERGRANTLRLELKHPANGLPLAISAATLTLYDSTGTAQLSAVSATVSSTEAGVVSYAATANELPSTLALGEGWREVWTVTSTEVSPSPFVVTVAAALCRYVPRPSLTNDTLYTRHSDLRTAVPEAQSAVGWTPQIHLAWREIEQRLYDQGRRPWLVVSGGSIARAHTAYTLAMIYRDLQTYVQGDAAAKRARLATDYAKEFDDAWAALRFDYDRDEDGIADGQMSARSALVVTCGPRTTSRFYP